MGGPIWSAPIHDQEWVASILADVKSMKNSYPAYDRISAVLTTISEVWFFLFTMLTFWHNVHNMVWYDSDVCFVLHVVQLTGQLISVENLVTWKLFSLCSYSNIWWVSSFQELPDVPLFLSLHNLCATLKCTSPSAVIFRSAVINAGYRISGTHVNPLGLKSDAPMDVIWDIMRCWVRDYT